MKINKLNTNQICSVESFFNSTSRMFTYKKAKNYFFWKQQEGYYFTHSIWGDTSKPIETKEIEKDGQYVCRDGLVYYKPHLEIKMTNQTVHEKYFNSEKELLDFMESEPMKAVNWINKK